ncbi:uncharacterized protein C9orf85 homolog [Episyrphus balteatus]|uniref:uncharacterized protein C9orf85 homolog n=1 Tax=Episyrphus balteatus TaxID=286459 RepID=UPI002485A91E|nr:uncharacterized protein C9orf85 homolog [Episyrphus balteatus]XP_055843830.1 uncharacterized protein C9orf85 homolog [Episyrphus balteatus]XP_055843831.1 uncharacterized protein C9orf85 homolog [Episyrphus balteatus]
MSSQRGNAVRTRTQKHKNRHVFKNDLHDKTPQQKMLNSLHISEVCQRCKHQIEWKIKYKKYKPLTQPKTCVKCQQRNIRKAYHVLCRDCAKAEKVCAKCLKTAEEVEIEPAQPTPEEELKLKVEMDKLIKSFPERKRRAFLRYMRKGEVDKSAEKKDENEETSPVDGDEKDTDVEKPAPKRIPHSRDDLLKKIEELRIGPDVDSDLEEFTDSDYDDDSDDYEEESD